MSPRFVEDCLEVLVAAILVGLLVVAFFQALYWVLI